MPFGLTSYAGRGQEHGRHPAGPPERSASAAAHRVASSTGILSVLAAAREEVALADVLESQSFLLDRVATSFTKASEYVRLFRRFVGKARLAGVAQIPIECNKSKKRRHRARLRSLPHTPQAGAIRLRNGGTHMSSAVAIIQHLLTGGESRSVIWEWGHHMLAFATPERKNERKWIQQRDGPPCLQHAFSFVGRSVACEGGRGRGSAYKAPRHHCTLAAAAPPAVRLQCTSAHATVAPSSTVAKAAASADCGMPAACQQQSAQRRQQLWRYASQQ